MGKTLSLLVGVVFGLSAGPVYGHFFPEPKVEVEPVFVADEVIISSIRKENWRVTAIASGKARVQRRIKTDTVSNAPGNWSLKSIKNAFLRSVYLDRLWLTAEGEVIAGFDMRKQGSFSVTSNKTTVTITLGSPEILTQRLDPGKTISGKRDKGSLNFADNRSVLEAAAREGAEQMLVEEACKKKILEKARVYGQEIIAEEQRNLLLALGDKRQVIVKMKPIGVCVAH